MPVSLRKLLETVTRPQCLVGGILLAVALPALLGNILLFRDLLIFVAPQQGAIALEAGVRQRCAGLPPLREARRNHRFYPRRRGGARDPRPPGDPVHCAVPRSSSPATSSGALPIRKNIGNP